MPARGLSHIMKLSLLSLIAACGLAVVARAETYSYKEPFARSGAFRPDGVLTLENVNGTVEVRAWDRNEINIEGEKSAATAEELKKIDLSMDVTEGHAAIRVYLPKRSGSWFGGGRIRASVRFTIHVPASIAVEQLKVVNSVVTLDGLQNTVRVESVNGKIDAHGVSGDVRLKTVNGSITAEFNAVRRHQKLAFETVNGSITVRLPTDAGATIKGSVVNGQIASDFPFVRRDGTGGHKVNAMIGDGRASLDARTVNGGITIQRGSA